jgi:hypothetical protein
MSTVGASALKPAIVVVAPGAVEQLLQAESAISRPHRT